jgi:hypothetical protein
VPLHAGHSMHNPMTGLRRQSKGASQPHSLHITSDSTLSTCVTCQCCRSPSASCELYCAIVSGWDEITQTECQTVSASI